MPLRDWLLNNGATAQRRAQHNAQILAKQRGLMPWDEDEIDQEAPPDPGWFMSMLESLAPQDRMGRMGSPHVLSAPPVADAQEAPVVSQEQPAGFPVGLRRTADISLGPEAPAAAEPSIEMPQVPQPTGNRADVLRGYNRLGSLNVEEGAGDPQTSYSNRFGLSATFRPGTKITGVGDPVQAAETNATVAAQRDYDWRRGLMEQAAMLPEGVLRQLRTDPKVYADVIRNQTNALSQGLAQLGERPTSMLPSEILEGASVGAARAGVAAQPYKDVQELQALLGEAERAQHPAFRAKVMGEERARALGVLQPEARQAAEEQAAREASVRAAGSMWGTPAQTESLTGGSAGSEAPVSSGAAPLAGKVFTMAELQAAANEAGVPLNVVYQRALRQGARIAQ